VTCELARRGPRCASSTSCAGSLPGRRRAVLGEPLPYAGGAFDLVVCALAIHYAGDRAVAFAEFCRVLRLGGALMVTTQHPAMDWLRKGNPISM
jgi:SAM-dependent methyltransferase